MPLAIELAAARVKLLTPEQVLARLEHHARAADGGARDLPGAPADAARRDRLELRPARRGRAALVDRLSVFRGGVDLEVAEAVVRGRRTSSAATSSTGSSSSSTRASSARRTTGDEPRFTMLETIREYAAEMLAARARPRPSPIGTRPGYAGAGAAGGPAPVGAEQRLARPPRAGARQHASGARLTRPTAAAWRFWQQRGYLNEARARIERWRRRAGT